MAAVPASPAANPVPLLEAMGCHDEVHDEGRDWGGKLGIDGVSHQSGTVRFGVDRDVGARPDSYTHLTLPTNREV